jgi:transposase
MTCWRRLRDWQADGVWTALHEVLLDELGREGAIDWERVSVDSASVRAKGGGQETGPNPTDRGKFGSKHHIVVDAKGIPLAIRVTAANVHDSRMFEAMVDAIPAIAGPRGHLRRRPAKVHADKGYDYDRCRAALRKRGIAQRIARRGIEPKERLGRHRWVVERTIAWLHRFRRLTLRTARRIDIHSAFLTLAAAVVCHRFVDRLCLVF